MAEPNYNNTTDETDVASILREVQADIGYIVADTVGYTIQYKHHNREAVELKMNLIRIDTTNQMDPRLRYAQIDKLVLQIHNQPGFDFRPLVGDEFIFKGFKFHVVLDGVLLANASGYELIGEAERTAVMGNRG